MVNMFGQTSMLVIFYVDFSQELTNVKHQLSIVNEEVVVHLREKDEASIRISLLMIRFLFFNV